MPAAPEQPSAAAVGGARDVGVAPAYSNVGVTVVLRDRNYDELQARVEAMADPSSPSYHQFLTPDAFEARYAPTQAAYDRVIAHLRANGMHVTQTTPNRALVMASGPSLAAARAFGTEIHSFVQDGEARYGNVRPIIVPREVAPDVLAVVLNDFVTMKPTVSRLERPLVAAGTQAPDLGIVPDAGKIGKGPGTPLPKISTGPLGGWGPYAVANPFSFPVQSGWDGTGKTAAVIIDNGVKASDLKQYLATFQIKRTGTFTQVAVDGKIGKGDPLESSLDVETIAALAPGANVILYGVPFLSDQHILSAYNRAVSDKKALVVNSSFGGCDGGSFSQSSDQIATNAASMGVTFVASSGDQGSACYAGANSFAFGVNAPAVAPHFVGVGGSDSQSMTAGTNVWGNCSQTSSSFCASGGGVSTVWPIPSYQKGIPGKLSSKSKRNVPDVTFPAVDDYIVVNGHGEQVLGTSWSSPTYAGLLVSGAQACKTAGFGYANVTSYALVKARGEGKVTVDVIGGSNAFNQPVTKGYVAVKGYDDSSGLGQPIGISYIAAMCGKSP